MTRHGYLTSQTVLVLSLIASLITIGWLGYNNSNPSPEETRRALIEMRSVQ